MEQYTQVIGVSDVSGKPLQQLAGELAIAFLLLSEAKSARTVATQYRVV